MVQVDWQAGKQQREEHLPGAEFLRIILWIHQQKFGITCQCYFFFLPIILLWKFKNAQKFKELYSE